MPHGDKTAARCLQLTSSFKFVIAKTRDWPCFAQCTFQSPEGCSLAVLESFTEQKKVLNVEDEVINVDFLKTMCFFIILAGKT